MNRTGRGGPPKTGVHRPCAVCGADIYVRPSEGNRRFCSMACRAEGYRGDGNPKWKGGRYLTVEGHVYVLTPDHPYATQDGYVMEHRLVMEAHLGRYLTPTEQVHHVNEAKDDNRIENLELMADAAAHRVRHAGYQTSACPECGATVLRSAAHRRRWPHKFCSRTCTALYNGRKGGWLAAVAAREARRAA